MEYEFKNSDWLAFGKSVRGISHIKSGLRNQDAIKWLQRSGESSLTIIAVADGHGSLNHFRSDKGSRIAIDVAIDSLEHILEENIDIEKNMASFKDNILDKLPKNLVREWIVKVGEHWSGNPLTQEENEQIKNTNDLSVDKINEDPKIAYGTTLLAVALTPAFNIFVQIGDGAILTIDDEGVVSRPMGEDNNLLGDETTSLSMSESWHEFRIVLQPYYQSKPPVLILVSTDGFSKSFKGDQELFQASSEYLNRIRQTGGFVTMAKNLERYLIDTSEIGSGDDITLGIVFRLNSLEKKENEKSSPGIQKTELKVKKVKLERDLS